MHHKIENHLFSKKNRYLLNHDELQELSKDFKNSNILILGAAGSIGSLFATHVLNYKFKNLFLVDKNENAIAELARILNLRINKNQKIEYILT